MARLDYVRTGSDVAERIRMRRGGRLTPLDGMLLHSAPVADGWNSLLGAIRERTSLPAALRELVILRVAALNGAPYEWRAHEPVGRAAGLTDAHIDAVREGGETSALTRRQRATLDYTDAMTRQVAVPDGVFKRLRTHFDDRQIVELTATIGTYNLVSRFLVALEVGEGEEPGPRARAGGEPTDGAGDERTEGAGGGAGEELSA